METKSSQPTYSKEELEQAITKLETELEQSLTEWESANKSDRYWIDQTIEDLEAKISRYKSYRAKFSQEEVTTTSSAVKVGSTVKRNTTERGYTGTGTVIEINAETKKARVQWATNKTWYAIDRLILVEPEKPASMPTSAAERKRQQRERERRGETLPNCSFDGCSRQLRGKLAKGRGICSVCWLKTQAVKAQKREHIRQLRAAQEVKSN